MLSLLWLLSITMCEQALMEFFQSPRSAGTFFPPDEVLDNLPTQPSIESKAAIPNSFSLRDSGCIQLLNQGGCGDCWAASSMIMMTARRCLHMKDSRTLSMYEHVTCDHESMFGVTDNGCNSGSPYPALVYSATVGDTLATCEPMPIIYYPYPKFTCAATCTDGSPKPRLKSNHPYRVFGVENIQREIMERGPVTASIILYSDFFGHDPNTVYVRSPTARESGGHAVNIIGWGTLNGLDYWLVANSWGPNWCDHGYAMVQRGVNMINIESYVITATPLTPGPNEPPTPPPPEPVLQGEFISPTGGEHFIGGNMILVTFANFTPPGTIFLYAGSDKVLTLANINLADGRISWVIPDSVATGQYILRYISGNNDRSDVESASFYIVKAFNLEFMQQTFSATEGKDVRVSLTEPTEVALNGKLYGGNGITVVVSAGASTFTVFTAGLAEGKYTLIVETVGTLPILKAQCEISVAGGGSPMITVTAPSASSEYTAGDAVHLNYIVTDISKIDITLTNGPEYAYVAGIGIATGSGTFTFTIPEMVKTGYYWISVCTIGCTNICGKSAAFTIHAKDKPEPTPPGPTPDPTAIFDITQPNVDTKWAAGSQVTITWSSSLPATTPVTVLLYRKTDETFYFEGILGQGVPNSGTYDVTLSSGLPTSTTYMIRLVGGYHKWNGSEFFTITGTGETAASPYVARRDGVIDIDIGALAEGEKGVMSLEDVSVLELGDSAAVGKVSVVNIAGTIATLKLPQSTDIIVHHKLSICYEKTSECLIAEVVVVGD